MMFVKEDFKGIFGGGPEYGMRFEVSGVYPGNPGFGIIIGNWTAITLNDNFSDYSKKSCFI